MNPFWNRRNLALALTTTFISLAPLLRAEEPKIDAPAPAPTTLATQLADAVGGIREQSRQLVADCVASTAQGTTRTVEYNMQSACSDKVTYVGPVRYEITRDEDGIHLSVPLPVVIKTSAPPAAERRRTMLESVRGCESTIQSYWDRYGLRVKVAVRDVTGTAHSRRDAAVTVWDTPGRSDALNYRYQGLDNDFTLPNGQVIVHGGPYVACVDQCKRALSIFGSDVSRKELERTCPLSCELPRAKEFCNMMVHEVGHRLGLPDEYAFPDCTVERFVSQESGPWSTMAVPQVGILDGGAFGIDTHATEFFPRHIRTVLEPLCPATGQ